MKMHQSITVDRLMDAAHRRDVTLDDPGFCVACGHEHQGCEGDMREGECEVCGERKVYGAEELLLELVC